MSKDQSYINDYPPITIAVWADQIIDFYQKRTEKELEEAIQYTMNYGKGLFRKKPCDSREEAIAILKRKDDLFGSKWNYYKNRYIFQIERAQNLRDFANEARNKGVTLTLAMKDYIFLRDRLEKIDNECI